MKNKIRWNPAVCAIRRGSLWKKDIGQILKKLLKKSMMICMKS